MKTAFKINTVIILILLCAGCGGPISLSQEPAGNNTDREIEHKIWYKHNLWLVAQAYDIPVADLAEANNLKSPFDVSTGDVLKIPGASKYVEIDYKDPGWNVSLKSMSWPLEGDILRDWGSDEHPDGLEGIDINAPVGTIIRAARDGWVVYAGDDFPQFGNMIILQHRYMLASVYACNSENLVKEGMRVDEGEPIARVGICKGFKLPTLHFEVVYFQKRINPRKALEISADEMHEKFDSRYPHKKE